MNCPECKHPLAGHNWDCEVRGCPCVMFDHHDRLAAAENLITHLTWGGSAVAQFTPEQREAWERWRAVTGGQSWQVNRLTQSPK